MCRVAIIFLPCFIQVRIKNIITQYVGDRDGCGVEELIKELMQNSDDAQATEVCIILVVIFVSIV